MRHLWFNSAKIWQIIWKENKKLIIYLAVAFLTVSLRPFLVAMITGMLINELVKGEVDKINIVWIVGFFILAYLIPALAWIMQGYFNKIFWFQVGEKVSNEIAVKKGNLDVAVLEDPTKKDLINKVGENGASRVQMFVERQFWFVQNIVEVILAAGVILFFNQWVFCLVLAGTIPWLLVEMKYGKDVWSIHGWQAENRRRYWDVGDHLNKINWLIELKVFLSAKYVCNMLNDLLRNFNNELRKTEKRRLKAELVSMFLSKLAFGIAACWFVCEVIYGELKVGSLVFVLTAINEMRNSLSGCFQNMGRQYEDSLHVSDLFKFLGLTDVIKKPTNGYKVPENITPEIVFENVSFSYPGTDRLVLDNFNLKIQSGKKIAIVGINGAGKTTLIKLLCRFYDPTAGRILVDGVDLREIDLESWHANLGLLFQEYADYKFTVKEAVAMGDRSKPTNGPLAAECCVNSEAHWFINTWKQQYDQQLGRDYTNGVEPSRGQWQKLALARVFYRDPKVLILDEPTSSVDAEAEAKIFAKLGRLPNTKTVIFISHRFGTVRQADVICVVENGKMTEFGSHEHLVRANQTYSRLFNLQAKGYK